MKSFEISDYDMFSDEKDVVVATYKVKVEGTYDGKDMSGTYNAGSVWKQENGKWPRGASQAPSLSKHRPARGYVFLNLTGIETIR